MSRLLVAIAFVCFVFAALAGFDFHVHEPIKVVLALLGVGMGALVAARLS